MSSPECRGCRYYEPPPGSIAPLSMGPHGVCTLASTVNESVMVEWSSYCDDDPVLLVAEDFWCIRWEQRGGA